MAQEFTLTDEDIAQLEVALTGEALTESAEGVKDEFCKIWPTARQALTLLLPLLAIVPGVGVFAKAAIGVVVAAGDAAHKVLCG